MLRERGQGFGILVSKFPKDTSASYSLQEPTQASSIQYMHNCCNLSISLSVCFSLLSNTLLSSHIANEFWIFPQVMDFLQRLVQWKRLAFQGQSRV